MSDAPFGLLVVDKPTGRSSHDIVDRVRRLTGVRKVGHTGTLDPAATGVLVLMIGAATRLAEHLKVDDKRYVGVVRFGAATTTYDADGDVTEEGDVSFDRTALEAALETFEGEIEQRPPAWSALRHDGQRAYKRARRGEAVELDARPVTVHALKLEEWSPPDATVAVHCSSGTYVRSLAHDLGRALGCPAHLAALRRTACGTFTAEDAVDLDTLEAETEGRWRARLQPVMDALPDLPRVVLESAAAAALCHGRAAPAPELATEDAPHVLVTAPDGRLLAVASFDAADGSLRPSKVFARPEEQ